MNLKYLIGSVIAIPLLPIMFFQGKRIRASVPTLPEAGNPEGSSGNSQNNVIQLLTLGESSMAGVGVDVHEKGFTASMANELSTQQQIKVQWVVKAKSGYTVRMLTDKIVSKLDPSENYHLIVIGMGGNDAFTLNSPLKWRKQIRKLIIDLKVKFGETPIVFANMPPIKEFPAFTSVIRFTLGNLVDILGEELNKVIKEFKNVYYYSRVITIVDWKKRLDIQADYSDFFSDGVHPSGLTYQTWGKDLAQFIIEKNIIPPNK